MDKYFEMSLEELMDVEVSGVSKFEEKVISAPASVLVISEEEIKNRLYHNLSDVLKDIVFIDVVDNAGRFGELYSVKGIEGNDRFLVLIDGKKLNPTNGTFLSVGNSISLSFAKRIEIITGPSSAIYGADAFSGIINIISKDATEDFDLSLNTSYGSYNSIYANLAAQYKYNEDFSLFVSAGLYKSDGPDFVGRDSIYDVISQYKAPLNNEFEQPIFDHNVFIKSEYKNFKLTYIRQGFNEGNSFGQPTSNYVYGKDSKWALTNNIMSASYFHDFEDSKLSANMDYIYFEQDPESQFLKWQKNAFLEETFSQFITGKNKTLRGDINYNLSITPQISVISGLEFENSESIPPYANDQVLSGPAKYEGETADYINSKLTVTQQRVAGYLQGSYTPTHWFGLHIGGRYDFFSEYSDTFNPRIALILNPEKSTNIKLMYGTAFQAPSLFYQYEQWGSVSAVMLSEKEIQENDPGWSLKNQNITSWELEATHKLNSMITLDVSCFYHIMNNLIERNLYTDSAYNKYFSTEDSLVYSVGFRNENIGEQDIRGLTAGAKILFDNNTSLSLHYSYTSGHSHKADVDEFVPRIAPHKFISSFSMKNIFNLINLSVRYKVVGDIYNRNESVFPNGKQSGYHNIDLSLSTNLLWDRVSLYLKCANLLDNEYSHGGLLDQVVHLPTIPQPGLTAQFGLEVSI